MKITCHSDYGKLNRVFIKRPEAAFINDAKISNEWQQLNFLSKPDLAQSILEFNQLEKLLLASGTRVDYLPIDETTTLDSVYCRDASIATDLGMILCNMGKAARIPEPAASAKAFENASVKILGAIKLPGTVEGGDVAWIDEHTLAVGHTYRTNKEGIAQLKALLQPHGISVWVAELPHYKGPADVFHLMSVFSPVDKNLAVVYSPLMPISFRNKLLDSGYNLIEVPDAEWDSMGCNVLAIAPREVIVVKGNPVTEQRLKEAGCIVHVYEGNDISVKGGGGPTCLTRPIERIL
ncbi:MAG TPA: arginine deiminase family protein [Cyclobacteriaceae bacterium]|nr:arginine deiminase family protein [Cyclobacteriaceae bacterium]